MRKRSHYRIQAEKLVTKENEDRRAAINDARLSSVQTQVNIAHTIERSVELCHYGKVSYHSSVRRAQIAAQRRYKGIYKITYQDTNGYTRMIESHANPFFMKTHVQSLRGIKFEVRQHESIEMYNEAKQAFLDWNPSMHWQHEAYRLKPVQDSGAKVYAGLYDARVNDTLDFQVSDGVNKEVFRKTPKRETQGIPQTLVKSAIQGQENIAVFSEYERKELSLMTACESNNHTLSSIESDRYRAILAMLA